MHSFVRKSTGVPAQYKKTILENCIRVCAKDLRPYRMFETSSFCQLARSLIEIGAKHGHCDVKDILPSGVTVSRATLERCLVLKQELLPRVKQAIAMAFACGASTDMWTDDFKKVSYTCITLHFIDEDWMFQSQVICTSAFPFDSKTAANIKTELLKQLHDFGLSQAEIDKLVLVSDQGANIKAALSSWKHRSCNAHVLIVL